MVKIFILLLLVLLGMGIYFEKDTVLPIVEQYIQLPIGENMQITSPVFKNNTFIPAKYTCDGTSINPPLVFKGVPGRTESFVLFLDDLDGPSGVLTHWVLFHLNPTLSGIDENSVPDGAIEGATSFGNPGYMAPCPPLGQTHRYQFTLYALDTMLTGDGSTSKQDLLNEMRGHILASTQIIGTYTKSQ